MPNFGDKDFEAFLNNGDDDGDNDNGEEKSAEDSTGEDLEAILDMNEISMSQKRLLFDIIQQKLLFNSDLLRALTDVYIKNDSKEVFEMIKKISETSQTIMTQLDSLMTLLLDEMGYVEEKGDSTSNTKQE
jgi:hypothetical protein